MMVGTRIRELYIASVIGFWSECDGNILSMAKSRLLHLLSRLSGRVISFIHPLLYPHPQEVPWTPVVIGDDITREILKFLPVKSLMRFKCVSKGWLSIITDPSFTSAYTAGVEAVMVFRPRVMKRDPYKIINYMCINDTDPTTTCEAYHHSTVDHGGQRFVNTGVVNGLICFFNNYQLWLYNIATREKVQIPVGGRAPKGNTQKIGVGYRFGYDPATKLYKILKLSTIFDCIGKDQCSFASTYTEILTIGVDSSWRVIDSIQSSIPLTNEGIYSGGVIYGTEGRSWNSKRILTAFHVGEERFQCIPFPPPTLDGRLAFFLLSFFPGPCLALVSVGDEGSNTYNIYRFSFGEEAGGGGWKKEILTLPDEDLSPEGIFPNGKVLISDTSASDPPRFFLYSPITKEYQMLVVTNWNVGRELGSPVVPRSDSYYVEENIVSLKRLTSSSSSSCT